MITSILDWLDHRAGAKKLMAMMLLEGVPGGAKWRYVWGSCLAFVFSIQLITGLLLMTAYSPSSSQAWNSVHFIQYKMDFGWLIRGLHHFGSQTMMVLIALHMVQVVIAGAHLPPRELNWWLGIGLLSVTLGLSLTGYLLPWDQKGYWATDVATNIAGTLPEIGAEVKQQAVAGPDSGNHTLTRFYALHVAILPGLLILMLIAHIGIFRRHGVTSKENPEGLVTKPENEHAPNTEPFWPRQAFYDMLACMVVFGVMFSLVWYGFAHKVDVPRPDGTEPSLYESIARAGTQGKGAELDAAADRDTAGYPARPEWYFLFLFQLLKYFPGNYAIYGTVVIPNGVMVLLFLLPLFGIGSMRKFGHFVGILVLLTLLIMVGLLTLKSLDDDKPEGVLWGVLKKTEGKEAKDAIEKAEDFQKKVHKAEILAKRACQLAMPGTPVEGGHVLMRNDPFTAGQKLFQQKCGSCHNFTAKDGDHFESMTDGKAASDLGDFASEEWVRGLLKNSMDAKHFDLVKKAAKDDDGKPVQVHALTGMRGWRSLIDAKRKGDNWDEKKVAAQEAEFDLIAKWLADQRKPREERDPKIDFVAAQKAFFSKANKCTTCHTIETKEETGKGKFQYGAVGGDSGPELTNYGSAEWIRGMIMSPGHRTRYGYGENPNQMPAFRNMDGPGSEVARQEFRESNPDTPDNMIQQLSDIEREMIIRWMLRDYRPIFGGTGIAK